MDQVDLIHARQNRCGVIRLYRGPGYQKLISEWPGYIFLGYPQALLANRVFTTR